MKNTLRIAAPAAASLLLLACHKEAKTTAEKLQSRWQLQSALYNNHYKKKDHVRNYAGTDADFIDFRTDGTVCISQGGTRDTLSYEVQDDTHLLIDSDPVLVKNLSDEGFTLYSKVADGGKRTGQYGEVTFVLKK